MSTSSAAAAAAAAWGGGVLWEECARLSGAADVCVCLSSGRQPSSSPSLASPLLADFGCIASVKPQAEP
ncbi:hypothetical protein E2C01_067820 [Portunus trituberculatus]|uniref:Uncharacterized protein n=1 Tax=Portunus trituberculatus TaxID=210409 RepID=A0A5B7HXT3_PORTR|nr:hypothetical protein [Portunus trituberculatus]